MDNYECVPLGNTFFIGFFSAERIVRKNLPPTLASDIPVRTRNKKAEFSRRNPDICGL